MAQSYTQGATAYLIIIGDYMRKTEFAIQLVLVMIVIYGVMGLGAIIAATRTPDIAGIIAGATPKPHDAPKPQEKEKDHDKRL